MSFLRSAAFLSLLSLVPRSSAAAPAASGAAVETACNGVVDDVAPVPAALPGRALLLQPLYAQREAATDVANVASALSQAGVPFDRPSGEAAWTDALETLASTERYALAVVPGYLMGSAVNGEASEKLRMESQHHARATFAFSTGANEPIPTAALCALAMCPLASHGVMHPLGFKSLPRGTCQETVASYRADRPGDATLCV